eukprot:snap_masked-scaffold_7-processed-gene-3.43-mRNA-1 protein AED:1.00 eAED:1.00 QI:0/0/0/0/1/1/2/0/147
MILFSQRTKVILRRFVAVKYIVSFLDLISFTLIVIFIENQRTSLLVLRSSFGIFSIRGIYFLFAAYYLVELMIKDAKTLEIGNELNEKLKKIFRRLKQVRLAVLALDSIWVSCAGSALFSFVALNRWKYFWPINVIIGGLTAFVVLL